MMYVSGSGFSTFDASSISVVYQSFWSSSPTTVLKRSSRLYEYEASACVRNDDAFMGSFPSTRLTVPCSVPPATGVPSLTVVLPAAGDPDAGVLSLSSPPPQPTMAIAPAVAPVTPAICSALRRLTRCAVTLFQNASLWLIGSLLN